MLSVILRLVDSLKTILPHTTQKLYEYLDYDGPFGSTQGRLFGTQHVVKY